MTIAFGAVLLLLSGLAWLGQLLSAVAPRLAARLNLAEAEADVDPVFMADGRAEAVWDSLILWPLPLAAGLLLMEQPYWPAFGLVGGAIYVYFAGRGIAQRIVMQGQGVSIGKRETRRLFVVFLGLWGIAGATTIVLACCRLYGWV